MKFFKFLLFMLILCFVQVVQAQSFEKGKVFVSAGYGLLHIGTEYRDSKKNNSITNTEIKNYNAVPIALQIEYALSKHWSVGLSSYYEQYELNYTYIPFFSLYPEIAEEKIELLSFNARTNYHFGKHLSRFDPYAGVGIGVTHSFHQISNLFSEKDDVLFGEIRVGCRYFFTKHIAVQLEAGLGSIFVHAGLTAKF